MELGTYQISDLRHQTSGFRQPLKVMACSHSPSHIDWSTLTREWGAKGWRPRPEIAPVGWSRDLESHRGALCCRLGCRGLRLVRSGLPGMVGREGSRAWDEATDHWPLGPHLPS